MSMAPTSNALSRHTAVGVVAVAMIFDWYIAMACPPPPGPHRPWPQKVEDEYRSADYVLIGKVLEVSKVPSPIAPTRYRDRARVDVAEMLKGDARTFRYIETDNIDGMPSGCGYRIQADVTYLFMQSGRNLTMAIRLDEPPYEIDFEFTVRRVRELSRSTPSSP